MPRTKLHHPLDTAICPTCKGTGSANEFEACGTCGGNGYVTARDPVSSEPVALEQVEKGLEEQLSFIGMPDIDLTNDTPPPGRMANQTWRILEEQRQAAEDTIKECEHEIERWTAKLDDAMKTTAGCRAGQAALDGGL